MSDDKSKKGFSGLSSLTSGIDEAESEPADESIRLEEIVDVQDILPLVFKDTDLLWSMHQMTSLDLQWRYPILTKLGLLPLITKLFIECQRSITSRIKWLLFLLLTKIGGFLMYAGISVLVFYMLLVAVVWLVAAVRWLIEMVL